MSELRKLPNEVRNENISMRYVPGEMVYASRNSSMESKMVVCCTGLILHDMTSQTTVTRHNDSPEVAVVGTRVHPVTAGCRVVSIGGGPTFLLHKVTGHLLLTTVAWARRPRVSRGVHDNC